MCKGCKNCQCSKNICEWFEVGVDFGLEKGTQTLASFNTYEEAVKYKENFIKLYPKSECFIDGWIDKNNPKDVWWDLHNLKKEG